MGYYQVTVIVDGAVDEEREATDAQVMALEEAIGREVANGLTAPVELFTLWHDHASGRECECAQYATDHRPAAIWNI